MSKKASMICRVCAVEHGIERSRKWDGLGKCPACGEQHILFAVQFESQIAFNVLVDHRVLMTPTPAGHDEDGDNETQYWRDHACPNGYGGECGYYDYSHGPKNECPASGDEAESFRQLRIKERNRSAV